MKKTNKYSILVVVATMLCCSCSDFLDIEPKDRITGDVLCQPMEVSTPIWQLTITIFLLRTSALTLLKIIRMDSI